MDNLVGGHTIKGASKTKIVWTLGPASRSVEMIEKLLKAGMNVARFNFSHGSHEYHQETLDNLRTAIKNTGILCAVMLDTKGPEIRTFFLKERKLIELVEGQEITISVDYTIKGDSNIISMSYKKLADDLKPGDEILCSDGMISLTVLSCDKDLGLVRCRCEDSGVLGERENVYLPGIVVDLPTLTEKDKVDILQWGVPNKIDIIALSFVRKGSDLDEVSELLGEHRESIMLMSKIENEEGFTNLDEIMKKSDAVMVARGHLGMEMTPWKLGRTQKRMINKANALGKPIVIAIQMTSKFTFPRPARAEAIYIYNAVLDGTDCVMLSGVTAAGAQPETAVQTMSRICKEAEDSIDYKAVQRKIIKAVPRSASHMERTASSAISKVFPVMDAKVIIVLTKSGYKAELVAKYMPNIPILSVVDPESPEPARVASRGLVYRGIIPLIGTQPFISTKEEINFAIQVARKEGFCRAGDFVVAFQMITGCPVVLPVVVVD